ncbi:MAG TPA: hypothetical protein PLX50_02410 [Candidatus Aminicenantes bacterium]|nr:hypothetical protein [Candidatus Aminicenantes bacterium]
MDIKLTKEQFEKLLDLAYVGNWLVNSYRADDFIEAYNDLASHIYSYAPAFGLKDKISFDEMEGRYFPSARLEESLAGYIEDYEDWSFWDHLVLRLAERDLVREYGEAAVDNMEDEEFEAKRQVYFDKYKKEIEKNGLDNLELYKIS